MYRITTTAAFDSAHFLKDYNGKCANLHGHRWTVEAEFCSAELQASGEKRGMVVDFSDVKQALRALADVLDHALIIESGSLQNATMEAMQEEGFRIVELPFRPTAEHLAKHFFDALKSQKLPIAAVSVYETPGNKASYCEDI